MTLIRYLRGLEYGPSYRHPLLLSSTQLEPALAYSSVIAVSKAQNALMYVCRLSCVENFLICTVNTAVADVEPEALSYELNRY